MTDENKHKNKHIGSSLDDLLEECGILDETVTAARHKARDLDAAKGDSDKWVQLFQKSARQHEERIAQYNAELGVPDLTTGEGRDMVGYWRVDEGIMTYRKRGTTGLWDIYSREIFSEETVRALAETLARPVRKTNTP